MATQNQHSNYVNIAITTASQEKMTLMLYDGALKFTNQAILAVDENNLLKLNETIRRALAIIRELQLTLDSRHDISNDMNSLYNYIIQCLLTGNTDKDRSALEEARDLLKEFRDTWKEAMKLEKKQ